MNEEKLEKYFRLLGLSPDASLEEVKKAYRRLAVRYHPDRLGPNARDEEIKEAQKRFSSITEAYSILREELQIRERIRNYSKTVADQAERVRFNQTIDTTETQSGQRKRTSFWYPKAKILIPGLVTLMLFGMIILGEKRPLVIFESRAPVKTLTPETGESLPKNGPKEDNGALPEKPPLSSYDYFSINSSEKEVLKVQGVPQRISGNMWFYGLSTVTFRNGRVVGYDNFEGNLRVRLIPPVMPQDLPAWFTLGSNSAKVLAVQGTPTRIASNIWYYGLDRVVFRDGRVVGYDNVTGSLKVRLLPERLASLNRDYFSPGSTPNDVLAVQGTPTRVEGNRWYYGLSEVVFRDGKVIWVNNVSGNLKFVALSSTREKGKRK